MKGRVQLLGLVNEPPNVEATHYKTPSGTEQFILSPAITTTSSYTATRTPATAIKLKMGLASGEKKVSQIEEEDEVFSFAMAITSGSIPTMVLKAVIELDVLEIIKRSGPAASLSPAEIAAHLPTRNPAAPVMLDRMLRLLASNSILTCSLRMLPDGRHERLYGLAPVCKYLTKNEDGVSLAALCLMNQDKVLLESWHHMKDAVLEGGIPFNRAYGMNSFDYHGKDPKFNKIFNDGLANHSTITMKKMLDTYKGFQDLTSLVDVGGGTGASLNMIISKYPTIKGINFDLPHVIQNSPSYSGIEHIGGDMFVSIPKADAIFIKWVCHDWSDDHCVEFLKNCYASIPDHGKVIVCEYNLPIVPGTGHAWTVFQVDMIMLANNYGKERTEEEFETLAKRAGFQGFRVACFAYDTAVMEFLKKN